jgi:hypothetical protein
VVDLLDLVQGLGRRHQVVVDTLQEQQEQQEQQGTVLVEKEAVVPDLLLAVRVRVVLLVWG